MAESPFADTAKYRAAPELTGGWMVLAIMTGVATLVLVACLIFINQPPNDWTGIAILAVTVWLCNLAGFWIAFGKQVIRLAVIPLPFIFAFVINWRTTGGELIPLTCFYYGIAIVVAMTGIGLRTLFGQLKCDVEATAKDALQFDLRHLFVLMTTIAILVGVGRALYGAEWWTPASDVVFIVSALVTAISLTTIISIWAMFGRQITIARATALALASIAAAVAAAFSVDSGSRFFWTSIILCEQSLLIGSLLCVRAERYRFVKATAI